MKANDPENVQREVGDLQPQGEKDPFDFGESYSL